MLEEGSLQRDLKSIRERVEAIQYDLDLIFISLFGIHYGEATDDHFGMLNLELQELDVFGGELAGTEPISLSFEGMPSMDARSAFAEDLCIVCDARNDPSLGCEGCHVQLPQDGLEDTRLSSDLPTLYRDPTRVTK